MKPTSDTRNSIIFKKKLRALPEINAELSPEGRHKHKKREKLAK